MRAGDTLPPRISIVIPAFNESHRIADSLGKVRECLGRTPLSFEILVVDDGSTDGTAEVVRRFEGEGVRLIHHAENRGKGYSIRTGVLKALGTYVLFTDAPSIDGILSGISPGFARPVESCSIAWCASAWD